MNNKELENKAIIEKIKNWEKEEFVLIICSKLLNGLTEIRRLRRNDAFASALLYLAYRKIKIPKTLLDVSIISGVREKEIGRCAKKIKKRLGMHLCKISTVVGTKCITLQDIPALIKVRCERLGLCTEMTDEAVSIYLDTKNDIGGGNPSSIVGGCIYIVYKNNPKKPKNINARSIADYVGIAESTLWNITKKLSKIQQDHLNKKDKMKK